MPQTLTSINPATGDVIGEIPVTAPDEIKRVVARARAARPKWQAIGLEKRQQFLSKLMDALSQHRTRLTEITCREMGRPIARCEGIHDYSIELLKWNLDHAAECLKSETTYEDSEIVNEVVYEPRGVVACIMAWNFPIGNFAFSVVQALIAGNVVIIKYSEEVPFFSKALEEVCRAADLPEGVLSFVYGDGEVGELLTDEEVDLISFTGSSQTGRKLYIKAASKGIPAVLEMGGSSPGLIFPDVNIDQILKTIFDLRFANSGQFCDNLKRLIVHADLFEKCVAGLAEIAAKTRLGDPMDRATALGPLVAERQVVRIEAQVKDALDKGASVICGGKRPSGLKGAWYEPTILTNITRDMKVWTEEVFGPVLPVVTFKTYEEAMELANDTAYGLTGYVFTADKSIMCKATTDLKVGCVGINGLDFFRPQNPFGGYKNSGLGRENGKWGFHDVCQTKVIARPRGKD